MDTILEWMLGGGLFLGIAAAITAFVNSRNVKSEAKARDAKTPAELDNLVAVTHNANMKSILDVNAALVKENERLRQRETANDARFDKIEDEVRAQGDELTSLSRGLASAYAYITTLLKIIEEHLPGFAIPRPPEGYKRTPDSKG